MQIICFPLRKIRLRPAGEFARKSGRHIAQGEFCLKAYGRLLTLIAGYAGDGGKKEPKISANENARNE
jgi:hypothetical protein